MSADTDTMVIPAPDPDDDFQPPLHPSGRSWVYMMARGDDVVMADTRTALVCSVVGAPYYKALDKEDEDELLGLRYEVAVSLARHAQQTIIAAAQERGEFDPNELVKTPEGDFQLQTLMSEPTIPYVSPFDDPEWYGPCPLVLISTDYAPFSDRFAPARNVWYIDPSNEELLLDAMAHFDQAMIFQSEQGREDADDMEDDAIAAAGGN